MHVLTLEMNQSKFGTSSASAAAPSKNGMCPMQKITNRMITWLAAGSAMVTATIACAETGYEPFSFPEISKDADQPVVLGPAGETIEFIQSGATTCGNYLFAKVIVPPTVGPPPHVHHWTDEWFYAPNGGFVIFMGTNEYPDLQKPPGDGSVKDTLQIMTMRPKELFYGERYIVHGFANPTDTPQELYIVWTPDTPDVSILPYFQKAGVVRNPDIPDQKPDFMSKIRLVSMAPDYGINQSSSFWQYVDKVVEVEHDHAMADNRGRLLDLLAGKGDCLVPGQEPR